MHTRKLAAFAAALACALAIFAPRTAEAALSQSTLSNGVTYMLSANETVSGQILAQGTCNLDLNGYTLDLATNNAYIQLYGDNASLTIKDSSSSATGKILLGNQPITLLGKNSVLTLESGTLDGSNASSHPQLGGAVNISPSMPSDSATFKMTGGVITGCSSTQYGGAVYIKSKSTFEMTGGVIQNCSAPAGGGVYIDGGQASKNSDNGNFKMYGGTITGCTATTTNTSNASSESASGNQGDAVYINGNFYIHGSIAIDGNVYLNNSHTSTNRFIMVDGPLSVGGSTGYVDVFTTYTFNGYESVGDTIRGYGSAYTVAWNVSEGSDLVEDTVFCGYAAYFYNSAAGMNVAAGQQSGTYTITSVDHSGSYQDAAGNTWYVANDNETEMKARTGKYLIYVGRNSQHADVSYTYALKLTKYGESNALLGGAVFTVYSDAACTTAVGTITTGSDGVGYLVASGGSEHLRLGATNTSATYYLKETTAPTGYTALTDVVTITITNPVTSGVTGYSFGTLPTGYSDGKLEDANANYRTLVLTATDPKDTPATVTLKVTKTNGDGTKVLQGASFGLYEPLNDGDTEVKYNTDGSIQNTQVGTTQNSDASGLLTFSNVPVGTYILKETNPPTGYTIAAGVVVTVASDGTVSATQRGTALTVDDASFTVTDSALSALPATGGGGLARQTLAGTSLVSLAGAALLNIRRQRARVIGGAAQGNR